MTQSKVINYAEDYSILYGDRSLVDKGFVESLVINPNETDPVWEADKANYYTKTEINNFNINGGYF